jgi:hypothetical protein
MNNDFFSLLCCIFTPICSFPFAFLSQKALLIAPNFVTYRGVRPASAVAPMNLPRQRRRRSCHLLYAIVRQF